MAISFNLLPGLHTLRIEWGNETTKIFQYIGLGSLSLLLAVHNDVFTSVFPGPINAHKLGLETSLFQVTTVDNAGKLQQPQTHAASIFQTLNYYLSVDVDIWGVGGL